MKIILSTSMFLMLFVSMYGQTPYRMSYQSVLRDNGNNLLSNTHVGMRISLMQGSVNGMLVYEEIQNPQTNDNGLISVQIGGGAGFDTISWANGPYFITTETDPSGGANYSITGTSQLLSVPYALYAEKSGQDYSAGEGIQISSSNVIGTDVSLSVSNVGDTLAIEPGNYVIIPGISMYNSNDPLVSSLTATNITSSSALCGYTISSLNPTSITEIGVCWDTLTNPNIAGYHISNTGATGTFNTTINSLLNNKIYYARAYATDNSGTHYGPVISFSTTPSLPTVTTENITGITISTANSGGEVVDNGGSPIIARGVCWSTSQSPSIVNSFYSTDGTGSGSFTSNLTGLSSGTTYYIKAYATNSSGTGYGIQKSFTSEFALPEVYTDTVLNITASTAAAYGYVTSPGSGIISETGICWNISPNPTIYYNYAALGSGIGSFNTPLEYLLPNTTYYVRAYATTNYGTAYGEPQVFTTLNAWYEGFETGMPGGATGNWSINTVDKVEGNYSLRSNVGEDSIMITRTIITPGQFEFYFRCDGYINSSFYIDDVLQTTLTSGTWTKHSFYLPSGVHTMKWKRSRGWFSNTCYLDFIICPN